MKIKHLKFKIELEGHGIVNYDSGEQKWLWNRESKAGNKNIFTSIDDNNMYAKKHFSRDEQGNLVYKIKISYDALRNAIFKNDAIATNPSISHHPVLLNSFIGSTMGLVRGYMFAGSSTLKRKSPLTITSAIQTNNSISNMDFNSRSGEKIVADDSGTGDTTIFNKETIGDITYESRGFLDLQNLQFLSADTIFDRMGFNADEFNILNQILSNTIPNFRSELGYYNLKTSNIDVAEYGIKFSSENVVFLVKETLKRLLQLKITRAGAYADISSLKIQLIVNPLDKKANKWVDITNNDDIDALDFEVEDYYVLVDETEAKKQRVEIEAKIKAAAIIKKAAKEAAAIARKAAKDAAKTKND